MREIERVYVVEGEGPLRELLGQLDKQGYEWISGLNLLSGDEIIESIPGYPIALFLQEGNKVSHIFANDEASWLMIKLLSDLVGKEIVRVSGHWRSKE